MGAREDAEVTLFAEIRARYPYLNQWVIENAKRIGPFCLAILSPGNIRDDYHRIVHDHELRERARPIIRPDRVNDPKPNAVLVIVPAV